MQCKYVYDAWGNHKVYNASGSEIGAEVINIGNVNSIRYRGYYWDKEFNLYYLQSRYYDPTLGRFISPDAIDYLDPEDVSGLNLYAYGLNNPVMYVDPTGHFVFSTMLVGALVGFGVSFVSSLVSQVLVEQKLDWEMVGIAAIDGVFGGISGALATIPGLGPLAYGVIDAGLSFLNGLATSAIINNGVLTSADWISSAYSAGLSFVSSSISRRIAFKGGEKELMEKLNKQTKIIKGRINSGHYMKKGGYRSISDASRSINKAIMDQQFGKGFYWDYAVDFAQTYSSALFGLGLEYLH